MTKIPNTQQALPDRPHIHMLLQAAAERSYLLRTELHTSTDLAALVVGPVRAGRRARGKRHGRPDAAGTPTDISYRVAYATGPGGRRWWYAPSSPGGRSDEVPGFVFPPPGDGNSDDYALCDGRRTWTVSPDQVVIEPAGPAGIPLDELLDPSWLLSRHNIVVEDVETVDGRPGVRIRAVPRRLPATKPGDTEVVAVVDIEYGFLLRCQHHTNTGRPRITRELRGVLVDPDEAATFTTPTLPPRARVCDQTRPGWNRSAPLPVRLISAAILAGRVLLGGLGSSHTRQRT